MRESKSVDTAETAWRSFLHSLDRVWTKLGLECKAHPRLQSWWSNRLKVRGDDMLLRYLHHARNSDEHTLTEVVSLHGGRLSIQPPAGGKKAYLQSIVIGDDPSTAQVEYTGAPLQIERHPPHLRLETVYDRGVHYAPPTEHLLRPLAEADPLTVAALGLAYCSQMLDDAETRLLV